jgi:hypothetical protein
MLDRQIDLKGLLLTPFFIAWTVLIGIPFSSVAKTFLLTTLGF